MTTNTVILIHVGKFKELDPSKGIAPPLGILYLASYLNKHGFSTITLDTRLIDKDSFLTLLATHLSNSLLIGLSIMTPLVKEGLEITSFIKRTSPSTPIVWGGFHATLYPESTIRHPHIDYVIMHEGEKALLNLAGCLHEQKPTNDIPNLVFKQNTAIIKNQITPGEDLDTIGIPDYQSLNFTPYIEKSQFTGDQKIDILTSRGCTARCTFCINSILHKSSWRHESIQQTLRNIDTVRSLFHPKHICFTDEDFFCDMARVKLLLPEFKKRGFTWDANCRAYHFRGSYLNDEMLSEMHNAGCRGLRFGLESGSQRILNMLKKGLTPQQSIHAIKQALQHSIIPNASFMFGIPGETLADALKTMDLVLQIKKIDSSIDILGPQMFRPYPGSILFNTCLEKGLRPPEDLQSWNNFYIYENAKINKTNYPWLSNPDDFRRLVLWRQYLDKQLLPKPLHIAILKFHIITKLIFIDIDYMIYKILKKVLPPYLS